MVCKGYCTQYKQKIDFTKGMVLGITHRYCATCHGYFPISMGVRCQCCHFLFRAHGISSRIRKKLPGYINKRI